MLRENNATMARAVSESKSAEIPKALKRDRVSADVVKEASNKKGKKEPKKAKVASEGPNVASIGIIYL